MSHSNRGVAVAASLVLLCAIVALSGGVATAASAVDAKPSGNGPVNLNTAGTDQLTAIPGIGEAMARRIVEWRDEHGPFRRVEDLMKVKGIGEKSLEKMRPHVTIGKNE